MTDLEKLEGYLINLGLTYEKAGNSAFVINDSEKDLNQVAVMLQDPVVIVRVPVMKVPTQKREEFFEKVLKLNGDDLVFSSYGIVDGNLILSNSMVAATLDLEELQTTLDEISLILVQHYNVLSNYK